MIAAATTLAAVSAAGSAALGPVLNGYDCVEYFSLDASDDGVQGSANYQADLTSSDLTNNTVLMEVRTRVLVCVCVCVGVGHERLCRSSK